MDQIGLMNTHDILRNQKRVIVIGISANSVRPSHWIARYLQDNHYEVIGVNPGLPAIPGIRVVASLDDIEGELGIVNVYRSPDSIPEIVKQVAPRKPSVFWLQPGAENSTAEEEARALGMHVISGKCIFQDHQHMMRAV